MTRQVSEEEVPSRGISCLTEMSTLVLIAGSLGVSALFWFAILAVL